MSALFMFNSEKSVNFVYSVNKFKTLNWKHKFVSKIKALPKSQLEVMSLLHFYKHFELKAV